MLNSPLSLSFLLVDLGGKWDTEGGGGLTSIKITILVAEAQTSIPPGYSLDLERISVQAVCGHGNDERCCVCFSISQVYRKRAGFQVWVQSSAFGECELSFDLLTFMTAKIYLNLHGPEGSPCFFT